MTTSHSPFTLDTELCKELRLKPTHQAAGSQHPTLIRTDPSAASPTLPGQPRISLEHQESLEAYLAAEHLTPELDQLAPYLWLTSTPSSTHISPLHHQQVRGREIISSENPSLHLVWHYNRIFIKPIPRYLLSHAFWQSIRPKSGIYRASCGFLRSYAYLVRYEVDFHQAVSEKLRLIPRVDGNEPITYERFALFIAQFERIPGTEVSPRYDGYGELRLSRLNMCTRIVLRKLTFHHVQPQLGAFVGSFLAPFLTFCAVVSVMLSAMQVQLATAQVDVHQASGGWSTATSVFQWFSVGTLLAVVFFAAALLWLFSFMLLHEFFFSRRLLKQRNTACQNSEREPSSAVV
ncbi:hypothetical protein F5B20DRAFT_130644 [Whalleya microplaca]|nr:hypothetical protein F5B20DRAFT_130644 [Whalleya microplaca]